MGILVLALLIVSVLVFGILFFIFRTRNPNKSPLSNKYYWVLSLLAVPIVFVGVIYFWYLSVTSFDRQQFDQTKWAQNTEERYLYVDDLISSNKLIGLSESEIKSLLGEVEFQDDLRIGYYIGYSPEVFLNMNPDYLVLELANNKVNRAYVQH